MQGLAEDPHKVQRIVTGSRQALEEMYLPLLRGPAPGVRRAVQVWAAQIWGGTSVGWYDCREDKYGVVQGWGSPLGGVVQGWWRCKQEWWDGFLWTTDTCTRP